ncbi:MAG: glycosyltransferase family 4 protein [Gammaproteobacteria bacterium]
MIIITTQCFPPRPGGIEHLMHALATALTDKGLAVQVWADGRGTPEEAAFDAKQAFAIRRFGGFKPWRRIRKARALGRLIPESGCTGVVADSWKSLEWLTSTIKIPVLCLAHGTELPAQALGRKARRIMAALGKTSTFVANSRFTAQRLQAYAVDPARIHVIHPGLAAPAEPNQAMIDRINRELAGSEPRLVSVGRLEPRKGVDSVLRGLPRLIEHHPRLLYLIVGDGSARSHLESMVRQAALTDHVRFMGAVSNEARNTYLAASDLFVLPGRAEGNDVEGFGIAFIEAAWFGVPAIADRSGGAGEAVLHEETGLTCRGEDDEAVFAAISRLLGDAELRRRLGYNARARARQFLWENVADAYLSLLSPLP